MIIRSRAPLRLGFGGGGTDVSPYSDEYGGYTLSATINMYAYCTIEPTEDHTIEFLAPDLKKHYRAEALKELPVDDELPLHKEIYNEIVRNYNHGAPLSFRMITFSDALPGSGLGSSSTMVVAILHAFMEWLHLPLGDYDLARLAYSIERENLGLKGGRQDQYSAAFGGINFMEYYNDNKVIVNPLRIKPWVKNELEDSLVLFFTGQSRDSSTIIEEQMKNAREKVPEALKAMHRTKQIAMEMKEKILTGDIDGFMDCVKHGWESKKKASSVITNEKLDSVYRYAMQHGALAGKVSGAGGGGFFMFFVDIPRKPNFIRAMENYGGKVILPKFVEKGSESWSLGNSKFQITNTK
ncbi:MAG: dehydrogenase [Bacteroidales bacterium]|nr:dehydrogenase [Bacteroidales bacterium]